MNGAVNGTGNRTGNGTGPSRARASAGFTLIEILVVASVIGLTFMLVTQNLGGWLPDSRLDGSAKQLVHYVDFLRSQARINGKQYVLELDLDRARWRCVEPGEERFVTDQDLQALEPHALEWKPLEDEVQFAGAGDPVHGIARHKVYKVVFDENGFTGDQQFFLRLHEDNQRVWSVLIRGLTGHVHIERSFDGKEHYLDEIKEGAF